MEDFRLLGSDHFFQCESRTCANECKLFLNLHVDCTGVTKSCRINEIIFVSDKEHCMDNLPKNRVRNDYFSIIHISLIVLINKALFINDTF